MLEHISFNTKFQTRSNLYTQSITPQYVPNRMQFPARVSILLQIINFSFTFHMIRFLKCILVFPEGYMFDMLLHLAGFYIAPATNILRFDVHTTT